MAEKEPQYKTGDIIKLAGGKIHFLIVEVHSTGGYRTIEYRDRKIGNRYNEHQSVHQYEKVCTLDDILKQLEKVNVQG